MQESMRKHNRDATVISMILGFTTLALFVDAMDKIRREIYTIPNIVKNAPHTQSEVCGEWIHAYTREEAVFPNSPKHKFWPAVARIDNVYGDRNLVCSCNNILEDENL